MATFESTFPKNGASTRDTDGHSTFWPIICEIFCRKAHQHPLAQVGVGCSNNMQLAHGHLHAS